MSVMVDNFGNPILLPIATPATQVILHEDVARIRGLEDRIKRLEGVILSRYGGEPLALLDELDAWRQYALDVEEYTEIKLGIYLDRREWSKVKEGKPEEQP